MSIEVQWFVTSLVAAVVLGAVPTALIFRRAVHKLEKKVEDEIDERRIRDGLPPKYRGKAEEGWIDTVSR